MAMAQVAHQAGHVWRCQRFAAKLLEQLEQHACQWLHRTQALVQVGIGMRQAQCHAIGRAPKGAEVIGLQRRAQVRRKQRQYLFTTVEAASAKVQVGFAADGTNGRCAQFFNPLLLPGGGLDVGGRETHVVAASAPAPSA